MVDDTYLRRPPIGRPMISRGSNSSIHAVIFHATQLIAEYPQIYLITINKWNWKKNTQMKSKLFVYVFLLSSLIKMITDFCTTWYNFCKMVCWNLWWFIKSIYCCHCSILKFGKDPSQENKCRKTIYFLGTFHNISSSLSENRPFSGPVGICEPL